jgi:transmembrane sensor
MKDAVAGTDASRFQEACDWFLRLREEGESSDVILAWLTWCASDARNREAFEEARELWQTTGLMPGTETLVRNAKPAGVGERPAAVAANHDIARGRSLRRALLAAALSVLAIGGVWLASRLSSVRGSDPATSTYTSAQSEHRSFRLADGSFVDLAGDSVLHATLREHSRELELERGEAFFRVAHDKSRPFTVRAGGLHVRALGTSFDVRTTEDRVIVSVEEGTVMVEPQPQALSAVDSMLSRLGADRSKPVSSTTLKPMRVTGGHEFAVGATANEAQLLPIEPTAVASWRDGRLRFVREPLRSVVASIRAATGRDIELADPQLGELRFTGTVFSSRVEAWAQGLPAIFPLTVHQEGSQLVILAR